MAKPGETTEMTGTEQESRAGKLAPSGNREVEWISDAVAEMLSRIGLKYLALVPGASFRGLHDSIVNYLGNAAPELIVCLHEGQAVSIADGYGRATDEPMGVALHSNVGLMHASMAIYNAWCARVPMVILGATGPVDAHQRRPWIDWIHTSKDQGALVRPFVKWDDQPASAEAAIEALLRANQIVRTAPKGPAYVCLDAAMQEEPAPAALRLPDPARFRPAPDPAVPQEQVAELIACLRQAKFPLLLVGRVSRRQEDWDRRVRLAEALGCPVFTTLHNPACFPTEHALHLAAPLGDRTAEREIALLKRADLLVSLDWHDLAGFLRARLGEAQTQQPAEAKIVHCSPDAYATNGWSMDHQALPPADIPILAHPDRLVAQLLEALARDPLPKRGVPDFPHWTEEAPPAPKRPPVAGMATTELAFALAGFARSRKVTFARLPIGWPGQAARFTGPLDYMGKDAGGAVGTGPGHSVGTALALKGSGRLVIGVIGDGDFLMGVNALWTAAHMSIPVMIVVANNRAFYNDVVHQETVARQRKRPVENRWIGQDLSRPAADLVGLAKAQGFSGAGPVRSKAEFLQALQEGADIVGRGGQFLIDAVIDPGA